MTAEIRAFAMGGYGSGRQYGRPIAEDCHRVDLAWLMRTQGVKPGHYRKGSIYWTRNGQPSGSIGYEACFSDTDNAKLVLIYSRGSGDDREQVRQEVRLVSTPLNFGGRRWWMICPFRHVRCRQLYLPPNGDRFASRKAWRLGYRSQRDGWHERPFEQVHRLQRKVGGKSLCYEDFPSRPKHMRHATYQRHWARFEELLDDCESVFSRYLTG